MVTTDYLNILKESYDFEKQYGVQTLKDKYGFLSEYIFDFFLYEDVYKTLFGQKAVEVCTAITLRDVYTFIEKSKENYTWFLVMCNMPFFLNKTEYGVSIRGVFWRSTFSTPIVIESCGLWKNNKQVLKLSFSSEEWKNFCIALKMFTES